MCSRLGPEPSTAHIIFVVMVIKLFQIKRMLIIVINFESKWIPSVHKSIRIIWKQYWCSHSMWWNSISLQSAALFLKDEEFEKFTFCICIKISWFRWLYVQWPKAVGQRKKREINLNRMNEPFVLNGTVKIFWHMLNFWRFCIVFR